MVGMFYFYFFFFIFVGDHRPKITAITHTHFDYCVSFHHGRRSVRSDKRQMKVDLFLLLIYFAKWAEGWNERRINWRRNQDKWADGRKIAHFRVVLVSLFWNCFLLKFPSKTLIKLILLLLEMKRWNGTSEQAKTTAAGQITSVHVDSTGNPTADIAITTIAFNSTDIFQLSQHCCHLTSGLFSSASSSSVCDQCWFDFQSKSPPPPPSQSTSSVQLDFECGQCFESAFRRSDQRRRSSGAQEMFQPRTSDSFFRWTNLHFGTKIQRMSLPEFVRSHQSVRTTQSDRGKGKPNEWIIWMWLEKLFSYIIFIDKWFLSNFHPGQDLVSKSPSKTEARAEGQKLIEIVFRSLKLISCL